MPSAGREDEAAPAERWTAVAVRVFRQPAPPGAEASRRQGSARPTGRAARRTADKPGSRPDEPARAMARRRHHWWDGKSPPRPKPGLSAAPSRHCRVAPSAPAAPPTARRSENGGSTSLPVLARFRTPRRTPKVERRRVCQSARRSANERTTAFARLALPRPQMLLQPRHQFHQIARTVPIVQLRPQNVVPAVLHRPGATRQSKQIRPPRNPPDGAGLHRRGADLLITQHAEKFAESLDALLHDVLEGFGRHVTPGYTGASGRNHNINGRIGDPPAEQRFDRRGVVLLDRAGRNAMASLEDPLRQRVARGVVVEVRVSETVKTAMLTEIKGRLSSMPAMAVELRQSQPAPANAGLGAGERVLGPRHRRLLSA